MIQAFERAKTVHALDRAGTDRLIFILKGPKITRLLISVKPYLLALYSGQYGNRIKEEVEKNVDETEEEIEEATEIRENRGEQVQEGEKKHE
jgi:hypothetical protein